MAPLPSSLPATQSQVTLQHRPTGAISPDITSGKGTFLLETNAAVPKPGDGKVVIKTEWVSIDPAMRGWLNPTRSYVPPVAIGAVMRAGAVGRLAAVDSNDPATKEWLAKTGLKVGDWVSAVSGWAEYAALPVKEVQKIEVSDKVLPTYHLGALGMPGQTAYWGLFDIGKIKKGETVVVSGAAGAVGSIACQIAKVQGCRVIAIAGGAEKCKWLKEVIGVDAALDYKSAGFKKEFKEVVGYLDVYFDNVGGEILDLCLTRLNKYARIALCGAISAYNDPSPKGLQMYLNLISQSASISGFIVFNYAKRYAEAEADLAKWIASGQLKIQEHRLQGLDQCVPGLLGLFKGENTGKVVVKIGSGENKL